MSIKNIRLRKLLKLFYCPRNTLISELRADIRNDNVRGNSSGGDFYVPFWSDAKRHVARQVDLREEERHRVSYNNTRNRLYPLLTDGFLKWWNEKSRWRNEPVDVSQESARGKYPVPDLASVARVENLLILHISGTLHRIIYPYFSEDPPLSEEASRIGLWIIREALKEHKLEDMRILDILRSKSFSPQEFPLQGNEHAIFLEKYKSIIDIWENLREEY